MTRMTQKASIYECTLKSNAFYAESDLHKELQSLLQKGKARGGEITPGGFMIFEGDCSLHRKSGYSRKRIQMMICRVLCNDTHIRFRASQNKLRRRL